MKRSQLEHIIRACADISDDDEIIVIGSQAILGQVNDPPTELCVSIEADVFPKNHPERWDLIDGSIGELSPFHDTFGYYAHGVDAETAILPQDWRDRLVPFKTERTRGATGLCLEIHDLLIAKYAAGRAKDLSYAVVCAKEHLAGKDVLLKRLEQTSTDDARRKLVEERILRDYR